MNTSDNQPFPVADDRRHPPYRSARTLILTLCFMWSVFQLYVASVVPFVLTEWTGLSLVFNNQEVRQIHLAFAFALAMLAYPLNKQSPRRPNTMVRLRSSDDCSNVMPLFAGF
jgi:TRAP-type uncharacterized transport system fused permease subunit